MLRTTELVREFSEAFGAEWHDTPTVPTERTALLRPRLLGEEVTELAKAICECDRVGQLDALTDIGYVLAGTYGAFGLQPSLHVSADQVSRSEQRVKHYMRTEGSAPYLLDIMDGLYKGVGAIAECIGTLLVGGGHEAVWQALEERLEAFRRELTVAYHRLELDFYRTEALEEVHRANMSKLGPDGKPLVDAAGKIIKGPQYRPPNLAAILRGEGGVTA